MQSKKEKLQEIWNSQLIRSIRIKHGNISMIANYEENDAESRLISSI
jgi:hypothetical protein